MPAAYLCIVLRRGEQERGHHQRADGQQQQAAAHGGILELGGGGDGPTVGRGRVTVADRHHHVGRWSDGLVFGGDHLVVGDQLTLTHGQALGEDGAGRQVGDKSGVGGDGGLHLGHGDLVAVALVGRVPHPRVGR